MTEPAKPPRKKTPSRTRPSRHAKDPVERSDNYIANTAPMNGVERSIDGRLRAQRLRELIEPHNAAMIKVMVNIAMDTDHINSQSLPKSKRKPSIHASIRMECADRLLTRLHGKPKETMVHEVDDAAGGGDEVLSLLNNILKAVGAPELDAPKSIT